MEIADFVIHVHSDLPAPERDKLAAEIGEHDGVVSAHFSREHSHLLNVAYNPDVTNSDALLKQVGERGGGAFKVGL